MIGDFMTFRVKLLGEPVIVPLVSYVKCAADGTTVWVDAIATKQLLVEAVKEMMITVGLKLDKWHIKDRLDK